MNDGDAKQLANKVGYKVESTLADGSQISHTPIADAPESQITLVELGPLFEADEES